MGTQQPFLAAVIAAVTVGLIFLCSVLGIDLPFGASLSFSVGG